MTERRYIALQAGGNLLENIGRIRKIVTTKRLSRRYPVVRYERQLTRKRAREHYLFVGVDIQDGEPGQAIFSQGRTFLKGLGFRPLTQLLDEHEIKSIAGGEEIATEGFWFKYRHASPPAPPAALDLWDEAEATTDADTRHAHPEDTSERFDRLLWWISARGNGRWPDLVRTIAALELDRNGRTAASVLRSLVLLGHVESAPEDGRWTIAPSTYVATEAAGRGAFLAGARVCAIENRALIAGAQRAMQPEGEGPTRYGFDDLLYEGNDALAVGRAAADMADVMPNLTGWMDGLRSYDRPVLHGGQLEQFDGIGWQRSSVLAETDFGYRGRSGLYRLMPDGGQRPLLTAFYNSRNGRWLRADISGLKFAALAMDAAGSLRAVLDSRGGDLLVPRSQRWPLSYERTLVLTSGWLPTQTGRFLRYRGVGSTVAQCLCAKLGVAVEEAVDV